MPAERVSFAGKEAGQSSAEQVNPMAEMLERYTACHDLERGQIVKGVVVRINPTEIIVDIGAKCEGFVLERDLDMLSPTERERITIGSEVSVYVVTPEDAAGNIILSLSRAQTALDWQEAQRLLESQETIEQHIIGCNKGGVIVQVGRIRGFVPGSQLAGTHDAKQPAAGSDDEVRWAALIGKTLQLRIIEVDPKSNRLILSERAAVRDSRESQRERLLNKLREGDVCRGRVINLADFGAFIDLGGLDGLIHLSELSWKHVAHPREVLEVGQEIDVHVLSVDQERQRVALSLKRLQPDPWVSVEERYQEGQLVEGVITHLAKWGAFASLVGDEAIEGLIHISELAQGPVVNPRDVIEPGQIVTLRVVGLDAEHHRLALSLKQVVEGEFVEQDWKMALAAEQPEPESPLSAALSEAIGSSKAFAQPSPAPQQASRRSAPAKRQRAREKREASELES